MRIFDYSDIDEFEIQTLETFDVYAEFNIVE